MSWAVGYDDDWQRWIGYGVPAWCDQPGCMAVIDRGLSYVCGGEPYGGDAGCGLFFCAAHLSGSPQRCAPCSSSDLDHLNYYEPKPDHPAWIEHQQTDPSWAEWRARQEAKRA